MSSCRAVKRQTAEICLGEEEKKTVVDEWRLRREEGQAYIPLTGGKTREDSPPGHYNLVLRCGSPTQQRMHETDGASDLHCYHTLGAICGNTTWHSMREPWRGSHESLHSLHRYTITPWVQDVGSSIVPYARALRKHPLYLSLHLGSETWEHNNAPYAYQYIPAIKTIKTN